MKILIRWTRTFTETFISWSSASKVGTTRDYRLQSMLPRTAITARLRRPRSKPVYRQFFPSTKNNDRRARLLHDGINTKYAFDDPWGSAFCLRQIGLSSYY